MLRLHHSSCTSFAHIIFHADCARCDSFAFLPTEAGQPGAALRQAPHHVYLGPPNGPSQRAKSVGRVLYECGEKQLRGPELENWPGVGRGSQLCALQSKVLKPHRECVARPNFLPRRRTRVRMAMLAITPFPIFLSGAANDIKLTVFIGLRGRKPSSRHH
jgi:hypothetical protein